MHDPYTQQERQPRRNPPFTRAKRQTIAEVALLVLAIAGVVAFCMCVPGCTQSPQAHPQPTDANVALGGAYQAAWGHNESLTWDLGEAEAVVKNTPGGEIALAYLKAAIAEGQRVFANLTAVGTALDRVTAEARERELALQAQKALTTKAEEATTAAKTHEKETVTALKGTWAFKTGTLLIRIAMLLAAALALHYILAAGSLIFSGMTGKVFGFLADGTNLPRWGAAILSKGRAV